MKDHAKSTMNDSFFSIDQSRNYDTMTESRSDIDSHTGLPVEGWKREKVFSRRNYVWLATAAGLCQGTQIFLLQ